jgi:hypothetical protein
VRGQAHPAQGGRRHRAGGPRGRGCFGRALELAAGACALAAAPPLPPRPWRRCLPRRRRRSARAWPRPRGAQAPLAALDALLNTLTLPLDEGLVAEQTIFQACNAGAEARALQHMFLAERKVAQEGR